MVVCIGSVVVVGVSFVDTARFWLVRASGVSWRGFVVCAGRHVRAVVCVTVCWRFCRCGMCMVNGCWWCYGRYWCVCVWYGLFGDVGADVVVAAVIVVFRS